MTRTCLLYRVTGQAGAYTTSTVSVDSDHTSSILHRLESTARRGLRVCSQDSESKKNLGFYLYLHMDIFILQRPYHMQLDLEMLRTILVLSNKNCLVSSNKKICLTTVHCDCLYIYISIMAYTGYQYRNAKKLPYSFVLNHRDSIVTKRHKASITRHLWRKKWVGKSHETVP
jgi:hypothetical protein